MKSKVSWNMIYLFSSFPMCVQPTNFLLELFSFGDSCNTHGIYEKGPKQKNCWIPSQNTKLWFFTESQSNLENTFSLKVISLNLSICFQCLVIIQQSLVHYDDNLYFMFLGADPPKPKMWTFIRVYQIQNSCEPIIFLFRPFLRASYPSPHPKSVTS